MKWVVSTCKTCEFCTNGTDELHCPKQLNSGFTMVRLSTVWVADVMVCTDPISTQAGTFQEYVLTDGRYASRIPEGVKDEEAGPIMCGGVTAYTACKRSAVKPGQWLVVLGAGGGVVHTTCNDIEHLLTLAV